MAHLIDLGSQDTILEKTQMEENFERKMERHKYFQLRQIYLQKHQL